MWPFSGAEHYSDSNRYSEGYLKNNDVHTSTNWVAFGDTTAKVIREQYPERTVHTLNKSAEAAFITFLEENFSI